MHTFYHADRPSPCVQTQKSLLKLVAETLFAAAALATSTGGKEKSQ